MSRVGRRESLRLLETALDAGITHFDTARSYGFGDAESVVGEALAGQRERVTVTTKLGIVPPRRSAVLSGAKAVARGVLGVLPGLRGQVKRRAGGLVQAGRFDAVSMRDSLHTSLRQLRTESVDFLLLHEPSCAVLATGEPLAFLQQVHAQGKVRAFGVAVTPEVATYALEHAPAYAQVLQVPHGVFTPGLPRGLERAPGQVFLHSAMGVKFGELSGGLAMDTRLRARWSLELGVDVLAPGQLAGLALGWAMAEAPGATVLFSSLNAAHVRENAAAVEAAAPVELLRRFEGLVREWMLAGPET